MKQEPHNRMLVLTGAAGGREHEKRSKIGKMILENAEYTIFTNIQNTPQAKSTLKKKKKIIIWQ